MRVVELRLCMSGDQNGPAAQTGKAIQRSWKHLVVLSALALAVTQVITVSINSAVLMATAELSLEEVIGANFFVAGAVSVMASVSLALVLRHSIRFEWYWGLALSVVIIAASVMTSHAVSRTQDRALLATATALHHAATAAWV